ncbi:G-type lectin S-receptor-like serine/threonine-protein kinase At4g27290 [Rutidosis leptorrhynchoides]|uniref:G-type lectin S-receptor-like serine/threonine-protein kinase At4g27290 n=1 Tax=Rutidosis leptorrhynchoides TaxID=125765 RepID=UPI003A99F314
MLLPHITFFFLIMLKSCSSIDTISVSQNITDGQTIFSKEEKFEMGFFSPDTSKNRYLGIWFKNTSPITVVWVANRDTPLVDSLSMAKFDSQGIMSVINSTGSIIWSTSNYSSAPKTNYINPILQLLDDGNLVIKEGNNVIWQSFDNPTDTMLSGMKLGKNFKTGQEIYLTSWKSADDPSTGDYTARFLMVKGKYQQVYVYKSSDIVTRIGPYNAIAFAGQPNYKANPLYVYKVDMVVNDDEMYFEFMYNSSTFFAKFIVTYTGNFEIWQLTMRTHQWIQDLALPANNCDDYKLCGPYGSCSTESSLSCACIDGFEVVDEQQSNADFSKGCKRSKALDCGPKEGFRMLSSMKLPDTQNASYNGSMNLIECKEACKSNCSCVAYANPNMNPGGLGCLLWFGDLVDIREYPLNGQDLYVRLAASELSDLGSSFPKKKKVVIEITLSVLAGLTLLCLILALYIRNKRKRKSYTERESEGRAIIMIDKDHKNSSNTANIELPVFSLSEILRATDNFSVNNLLGEGGFGSVYKGVLEQGQEIAVKRLSKSSRQGIDEFENEVICIAKLQHRNLVKLLGYCIQDDETMLIYEYMPNKSLDWFIFDNLRQSLLSWPQRFHIIHGIARGLLYLHQDSRLRVVHRDLKAGNILLDHNMNPKISDFGLARMFKEHESEANTKKVVGTLGYISPEYAVNGLFSVKSDIFSFGVLILEIVSGKKNRGFVNQDHHNSLLGHAWRLYKDGKSLDLVDASLGESLLVSQVQRCIHIGLLCVQHRAEDRPDTPFVVAMLGSEGSLPSPKEPGFFIQGSDQSCSSSSLPTLPPSLNGVTLSQIQGR